jgi:CRISPR system Cascade subunit CasE
MYLSKLVLNPRSKQALKEVDDPYQMHRTLARAFKDQLDQARLLFRVDRPENGDPHVIVQSLSKPNWSALPEKYADVSSKSVDLELEKDLRLTFRLLARPTRRVKETGRRVTVRGDEALREWLERKAGAAGFEVKSVRINGSRWRDTKGGKTSQALGAVQFDGILVVTDPDKLREAVRNGIGPQKAYGFGLLSLAPLRQ